MRLLAAAPDPAQLVVLRIPSQNGEIVVSNTSSKELLVLRSELEETKEKAEEVQRIKESLRSDNIRLTHRISYLEEQVKLSLIILWVGKFSVFGICHYTPECLPVICS